MVSRGWAQGRRGEHCNTAKDMNDQTIRKIMMLMLPTAHKQLRGYIIYVHKMTSEQANHFQISLFTSHKT